MEFWKIIIPILQGAGSGFLYALIGYIKNLPEGVYKFDWKKASPALIIGAIAGVVAELRNMPLDSAKAYLAGIGVVALINFLWSAFLKMLKNYKAEGQLFKKEKKGKSR